MLSVGRDELAHKFQADFGTFLGNGPERHSEGEFDANETSPRIRSSGCATPQSLHRKEEFSVSQRLCSSMRLEPYD